MSLRQIEAFTAMYTPFALKHFYSKSVLLSQNYSVSRVENLQLPETLKLHPPSRRAARNRPTQALQRHFSGGISAGSPGTQTQTEPNLPTYTATFYVLWRPETAIATEGGRESILNRDLLAATVGVGAQRGRGGRRRGSGTVKGRGNRGRGGVPGVHQVSVNTFKRQIQPSGQLLTMGPVWNCRQGKMETRMRHSQFLPL